MKYDGIIQKIWLDSVFKTWSFEVVVNKKSKNEFISCNHVYTTNYKDITKLKEYIKQLNFENTTKI